MSVPISGAGRYIGQRVLRKEDLRLLTGRGQFVDDIAIPGVLHVAYVRSQIARGRIVSMDLEAARALPGVRAVLTAADLGQFNVRLSNMHLHENNGPITLPLTAEYVRYVGDPVAMVVAESRYIAEDAVALVYVEYDEEDPLITVEDAMTGPLVHADRESNVLLQIGLPPNPEYERILAGAAKVVTSTLRHQRIAQSTMETRGCVSNPTGMGELTVYIGCQSTHIASAAIAIAFGLSENQVRVIARDVGGGFGLKAQPWREEAGAIAASLLLRRPVKWIEDRLEALTTSCPARESDITTTMAFDADAKLLAMGVVYNSNNGAYPHMPDAGMPVMMFMPGPYRVPVYQFTGKAWFTNTVGLGGYRAPWAIESLARESLFDKAAREFGIDPIEIRRRNLLTSSEVPARNPLGIEIDNITPIECLDNLLTKIDVPAFRAEQAEARKQGRYLGLGIATYIEPTAANGIFPLLSDHAQIRIDHAGKVIANLSTHSQGQGIETTHAQIIAEQLGVSVDDVTIYQDDSTRSGFGPGGAGSRQAVVAGGAIIRTARLLTDKIKAIAAHALNANPDDITIEDGMVKVAGAEAMSRSLREIAELAYGDAKRLPPGMEAGLDAQYRYTAPRMFTHATAAHACVVEVDAETGFVQIKRWISSEDCGVQINPAIVEGQIAGGVAQAIGVVLHEEFTIDARGNPTAVTFKDYHLPAITDVPILEYTHISTPSDSEGGFRGVGEGGIIIGGPTLLNAVADAMVPFGTLPDDLPMTPSKLLKLMHSEMPA
ncbi:carbon-monoxide dehydrogenase large subunit [Novosphingobium sp. CF614]|uniref:xanthine dehydrogenase family protein molybdopterin-binding subunit n=1 Tax=Novosphingobium sp. CF614 TaxID=1884364 RepID=UPI0008EA8A6E|nr:xanthine dehydrogenase family protein molybdopterin-binding subunit [Novosphingobium sp. CF614]SFF96836.1 carbon-monoxide dehydrogenase large subunit [Novosphingobium sp. CF614]